MNLDARTLLFSLILTYILSVLSMFVAASVRDGRGMRDGMAKWAAAMFLQTLTWTLVAVRGVIPELFSIIAANVLLASAYALMLAAIHEFQQRKAPYWQYWGPIALTLVTTAILVDDIRGRFIWVGLIYAFQLILVARALVTDQETRAGRAWRLLFGGVMMILVVLGLRALDVIFDSSELAQPQNAVALQSVQLIAYVAAMAMALLGSIGFVLMVKERTDREAMHLAMTDSLTQVPNRRALMNFAAHVLARRSSFPVALLMIDLDNFKSINDTHGHLTGDEVLRKVSALIVKRLRGQDLLGRYGGEEFCVIAPETDDKGAIVLASSLRETIAATPIATASGELSVSVSIGISYCPSHVTRDVNDVLAEADAALYEAKQSGRNRVVCFGSKNG